MKIKLDVCPFCGGKAKIVRVETGSYYVCCTECSTKTNSYRKEKEAIKAWNKR